MFADGRFVSVVQSGIGAPSTEIIANLICKGGAKIVLRVDFCGALSPDVGVGDIFIASSAKSFDQVCQHYSQDDPIPADERLVSHFQRLLSPLADRAGIALHTGTICTVDIFFAQTDEMLRGWAEYGDAVDMESAAIYAIARHHGAASLAVMVVTDNKLLGHPPYSGDTCDLTRIVEGYRLLTEAVRRSTADLFRMGGGRRT